MGQWLNAEGEGEEMADHGLVLMFRPFLDPWVQPIAVFAAKNATKSQTLALIVTALIHLENIGARV